MENINLVTTKVWTTSAAEHRRYLFSKQLSICASLSHFQLSDYAWHQCTVVGENAPKLSDFTFEVIIPLSCETEPQIQHSSVTVLLMFELCKPGGANDHGLRNIGFKDNA